MKKTTVFLFSIFLFVSYSFLAGCSSNNSSAKTISESSAYPRTLQRANKDNRYYFMHSGVDLYRIKQVEVEKSKKQFTVHLDRVDSAHLANKNNPQAFREKVAHVYMRDSTSYTLDEPHTILLDKVARIEIVR